MAKPNKSSARGVIPAKRPRRASQRTVLSIDLSERTLRDLMIEQCKHDSGYLTVYRGSHVELIAAGIPEAAFPTESTVAEFQVMTLNVCCTGSQELLSGSMRSTPTGFELEIDWKFVRPFTQCGHPAVNELARMLLKDVLAWTDNPADLLWPKNADLEYPIDRLAADERAVEYKPKLGAPRLQLSAEFQEKLGGYASCLFNWVHSDCEVMPSQSTAAKRSQPRLRIVANTGANGTPLTREPAGFSVE